MGRWPPSAPGPCGAYTTAGPSACRPLRQNATRLRTPPPLAGRELRRTEEHTLALLRRWFFGRKPDAGFVLTDFPATLLQAKVFDEWLETRDETLSGVIAAPDAPVPLSTHYRTLGLLPSAAVAAEADRPSE